MNTALATALTLGSLALAAGLELESDYEAPRSLRITTETYMTMETTSFSMTVNGEEMQRRGGGSGGGETEMSTRTVHVDTTLRSDDDVLAVRRTFEELESSTSMGGGEFAQDFDMESDLVDVTLDIVSEDGDVEVEVSDGSEPDEELLDGHLPQLTLDALLPEGEVEVGDSWDLESEQVLRALGMDLRLFQRPEGGGEGRSGGEGRGRRGGRGAGGRSAGLLREAEWEGSARLAETDIEHDGVPCVRIELELEAEGEREDSGWGGGRGRGGQYLGNQYLAGAPTGSWTPGTSYEVELEGDLFFSLEEGRPVALELSGTFSSDTLMENERNGNTMVMERSGEGEFEYSVEVESIPALHDREDS